MSSTSQTSPASILLRIKRAFVADFRNASRSSVFGDLSFLALLGFALFLGLAFASFNPADRSYFAATWPPATRVSNLAGSLGAGMASFCFFFLGCASFLTPAAIALTATRGWRRRQTEFPVVELEQRLNPAANAWAGVSSPSTRRRSTRRSQPRTVAINPVSISKNMAAIAPARAAPSRSPSRMCSSYSCSQADTATS